MKGLPITPKYDKLLLHLSQDPCSTRIWGKTKPIKIELLYDEDGDVKKTIGEAIFIFEECNDEALIARRSDKYRLDKSHTLRTETIRVCKTCYSDINGLTGDPYSYIGKSKIDPDSCRTCVPDQFCCCCDGPCTPDIYSKYVACQPCRGNMEEQEKWRMSIPIYDTESSFKEKKYLCDEAIKREQELMFDGKPPVSEDYVTPFWYLCMDSLVDPNSGNYWPYGMSGRDYVSLQNLRAFNNPMSETPDNSWMDIEVTKEIINDYWNRMSSLQDKYDFKSLTNPGSLPTTLLKDGKSYRLVPDTHGFSCDDPTCQAINHNQNDMDGGGYAALVLTGLPIYTSREGDLTSESVCELGYGLEYCLACIMK
jgi:hypothetical protein